MVLLHRLDIANWGLPKGIMSDRDKKFMSEMWIKLFTELGVRPVYSTAYQPQTDGDSEQTVEIALGFFLHIIKNSGKLSRNV